MSNKKVLVVEDDVVLRDVLVEKLKKTGYETIAAADGEEAMAIVRESKPDLMLLDILMPRKGGMEVMEDLNADPNLRTIPVIIISNSGQPVEIERARHLGAKDFLIKAVFDPKEVMDKVADVLLEVEKEAQQKAGVVTEGNVAQDDLNAVLKETESQATPQPASEVVNNEGGSGLIEPSADIPENTKGKGSVLIVEDDKFLRELFVRKLFSEGFQVDSAIDSDEAFEILSKGKPDIIFLDLILPGMDGFEILTRIKKDDRLKNIPVMVISNLGQKEDIDRAMRLGATDFLVKANFTLDEIISRVQQILHG